MSTRAVSIVEPHTTILHADPPLPAVAIDGNWAVAVSQVAMIIT